MKRNMFYITNAILGLEFDKREYIDFEIHENYLQAYYVAMVINEQPIRAFTRFTLPKGETYVFICLYEDWQDEKHEDKFNFRESIDMCEGYYFHGCDTMNSVAIIRITSQKRYSLPKMGIGGF